MSLLKSVKVGWRQNREIVNMWFRKAGWKARGVLEIYISLQHIWNVVNWYFGGRKTCVDCHINFFVLGSVGCRSEIVRNFGQFLTDEIGITELVFNKLDLFRRKVPGSGRPCLDDMRIWLVARQFVAWVTFPVALSMFRVIN